ncbi:NAD-dependent epimerase/dehydratase family protein [Selenomonas montiformis]|uniref:NAD-dependent epimerase/dehydratase family protein n=1 Tax=Selenomonas montiformis TaxID=2652285 RepID=UPI003F89F764
MWLENPIFREDMEYIAGADFIPWEKLHGKTLLITGATGLIGFNLVSALAYKNLKQGMPLTILALVRDENKARVRFAEILAEGAPLKWVVGDLEHIPPVTEPIDYIIHGGSPTASRYFAEHPVETIRMNLTGAASLLDMAREKQAESFLFLSSMEVYGSLHREEKVSEDHESFVNTMNPRSSYPEAKRMVEAMCSGYAAEYHVPAKVIRLTQTFGAGVRKEDNRVYAQFMRSAMAGEDIVLLTKGGTRHSYLYTADAVAAILTVLLKGENGEAYNAANEATYCSIKEMAELVAGMGNVNVRVKESNESKKLYPEELYMNLDVGKLQGIGWQIKWGLSDMFKRMFSTCERE